MSNKSKSIKNAPKRVQRLASQFYDKAVKNPPAEMKTKEITKELIEEIFKPQFEAAKNKKDQRIVWVEYVNPPEEMKQENPNMDIFMRSTVSTPDKVILYFQQKADTMEYWDRPFKNYPCFKDKAVVIPPQILAVASLKEGGLNES